MFSNCDICLLEGDAHANTVYDKNIIQSVCCIVFLFALSQEGGVTSRKPTKKLCKTFPMTPFGLRLKFVRQCRGYSQLRLAELLRVSSRTISTLETGRRRPPSRDELERIGMTLGLGPEELRGLVEAAAISGYRVSIPVEAAPREIELVHLLVKQLGTLTDAQLMTLSSALKQDCAAVLRQTNESISVMSAGAVV
jgi:transcriptional regulator with XRE-family HTH domain